MIQIATDISMTSAAVQPNNNQLLQTHLAYQTKLLIDISNHLANTNVFETHTGAGFTPAATNIAADITASIGNIAGDIAASTGNVTGVTNVSDVIRNMINGG